MTKKRYGMLAGLAGAAFAAWWWRRHHSATGMGSDFDRGETIYSNSPLANEID